MDATVEVTKVTMGMAKLGEMILAAGAKEEVAISSGRMKGFC